MTWPHCLVFEVRSASLLFVIIPTVCHHPCIIVPAIHLSCVLFIVPMFIGIGIVHWHWHSLVLVLVFTGVGVGVHWLWHWHLLALFVILASVVGHLPLQAVACRQGAGAV